MSDAQSLPLKGPDGQRVVPASTASVPPSQRGATGRVDPGNFYELVGGRATFEKLVARFYQGVANDPPLRALYPEEDLAPAEQRLLGFLEQYWGGPTTYSEQRGHPRLRLRHMPFKVNPAQRERWLTHMRDAVESLALPPLYEAELWAYLDRAAHAMVNTFDD